MVLASPAGTSTSARASAPYETPPGGRGGQWTQLSLVNEVVGHQIDDLDALEVHGPGTSDDANFYSEVGDPGSVSVKSMTGGNYIQSWQILSACSTLGYTGPSDIDLDGLMVWDGGGFDRVWNAGDKIVFSIRASGNWHGGEIVELPFGAAPTFLSHGGHLWDNAPANRPSVLYAAFGVATDEVDGIEAIDYEEDRAAPALTEWGLITLVVLLIGSALFILFRRRRVTAAP